MKYITRKIDKFCLTHRNFGIPYLMRYVTIISAAVLAISWLDLSGGLFESMLYFDMASILRGQVWRLVTWVFVTSTGSHFGFLLSALMLYFYYYVGNILERELGTAKFNVFYFGGIALSTVYAFIVGFFSIGIYPSAFYLNLSFFLAYAMLYPDAYVRLFYFIPVKLKVLAWIDVAFLAWSVVSYLLAFQFLAALFPVIALANVILVCGLPNIRFRRARPKSNVIHFRSTVRRVERETQDVGYRHKCEVCGKTDASDPTLDFRYCARCEGYHCYCADHIETHSHVTDS